MRVILDFFKGFKEGMISFGENVALIINSLLLSIVYLIGIGLTSIFSKLFGKKFLNLKISKKTKSYWENSSIKNKNIDDFYRTF